MKRSAVPILLACAASLIASWSPLPPGGYPFGLESVSANEGWKAEFDDICSKTDTAMALSSDELTERVARCDRLKTKIEAQEESTRKVYLRRLQMCRDLYGYVLQSKQPR